MGQNNRFPCPIWGGGTNELPDGDNRLINNSRTGGRYRISRNAILNLENEYSFSLAAKLTTWIVDQHLDGVELPYIKESVITDVRKKLRLNPQQQVERFFKLLAAKEFRLGSAFDVDSGDQECDETRNEISAWTECETEDELDHLLDLLIEERLIKFSDDGRRLTALGFSRLEKGSSAANRSQQAFIAMWFDPSLNAASDAIQRAVKAAGYNPLRIDQKRHNNKIDDEIIAEIRRSKFVVADFTCGVTEFRGEPEAVARGGVYFEAGFAIGMGIPVIWSCRRDVLEHVHFDTRQYAHIDWGDVKELEIRLHEQIRATIGELPNVPGLQR